jgi:hypothetical protein
VLAESPESSKSARRGLMFSGVPWDSALTSHHKLHTQFSGRFTLRSTRAVEVRFSPDGPCEAMDGRTRAHMDVLVACPARPDYLSTAQADSDKKKNRSINQGQKKPAPWQTSHDSLASSLHSCATKHRPPQYRRAAAGHCEMPAQSAIPAASNQHNP